MLTKPVLVNLLPILIAVSSLAAQESEEPQTTIRERLEVTEVLLDVLVTDRAGNIIIGLRPEDFTIHDGERETTAKSATFYSNRRFVESGATASRLGVSPDEIPADRYFIFFFHDQRAENPTLTSNILDALRWTKDWVRYESLANDWIAILSYDTQLKVQQDFTNNKEDLLEGLQNVAKGKDPGNTWPSRIEETEGASLRKNLPQGRDLRKATKRIYSALSTVAEAAGPIIGRKNLLYFSIGFGTPTVTGTYYPDQRYYPPMMKALNANNVAVYSISWIKNAAQEGSVEDNLGNSLSLLSSDTDGIYYFNFVNFKEPLRQVNDDNNGYYLLSYDAEHPSGDQGYREVQVRTGNPDFVVRARKGYSYGN